jgi:Zn-dependent protease
MHRYTPRDIVVLALVAALFVWSFARSSSRTPEEFVFFLLALVLAVTFHECAHATVALSLGDATAKLLGRVSLNPIRHLDLFGSLAFLFIGFGWGKPVPINPYNMRGVSPVVGAAISAIAGPVSNVVFGFLAVMTLRFLVTGLGLTEPYLVDFFRELVMINIALAAFNFLPIPPLDGFSLVRLVLPREITAVLEQYGMLILIALIFLPQFLGRQFDILSMVMRPLQGIIQSIVFAGL